MKYQIKGAPMPVVICNLDGGESVICESGAMSWMTPNMEMSTTGGGGLGKMFSKALPPSPEAEDTPQQED